MRLDTHPSIPSSDGAPDSGNLLDLENEIATLAASLDAREHRLLTCIRAFDSRAGWSGWASCAHWLAWRVGVGLDTARERVRVARALATLPNIDAALSRTEVSYAQVRAMTRVATADNEGTLLEYARECTADQLERICRRHRSATRDENGAAAEPVEARRFVRRQELPSGRVRLVVELDPAEAELVERAIDAAFVSLRETAPPAPPPGSGPVVRSPDERDAAVGRPGRVDALLLVAESFLANGAAARSGGARSEVVVWLRPDMLSAKEGVWSASLADGSDLSAERFRRLACDCGLVATSVDEAGRTIDVGRRTRSIPPAVARALSMREGGRCCFPGCSHRVWLEAHHVRHWMHGGETKLENLALTCSLHHKLVHEGGWQIEAVGDGRFVFVAPDGRRIARAPDRPREVEGGAIEVAGIGPETRPAGYARRIDWECVLPPLGAALARGSAAAASL